MKILHNDYGRYAFETQLSRSLASRGHAVVHTFAHLNTTPPGDIEGKELDPPTFELSPIQIAQPLQKDSFLKRWQQEREYGRLLAEQIRKAKPEVVISANTPLDAQKMALKASRQVGAKFIFWLQDLIGLATQRILREKLSIVGELVGMYYINIERSLLARSDHIVLITEDFQPVMESWGIDKKRTSIIPNWAPIENIPVGSKNNPWALQHNLHDQFCFLYSGSLGFKHNPDLLVKLAEEFQDTDGVAVTIISEGHGAEYLRGSIASRGLTNIKVLPYQSTQDFPDVLAAGDVLIGILEPDAGEFSVPSKVLSYLCAGRPLLLSIPPENLAAKIVLSNHAGIITDPGNEDAFIESALQLLHNEEQRKMMGKNGRKYAQDHFSIEAVTDQFETILRNL